MKIRTQVLILNYTIIEQLANSRLYTFKYRSKISDSDYLGHDCYSFDDITGHMCVYVHPSKTRIANISGYSAFEHSMLPDRTFINFKNLISVGEFYTQLSKICIDTGASVVNDLDKKQFVITTNTDILHDTISRFNFRPSEITSDEYHNSPLFFLCLSIMSERGKMENEVIEDILKDTTVYNMSKGITRKSVWVSTDISDYTLGLFKMMGYRIRVTGRLNVTALNSIIRFINGCLR